MSTQPYCTLTKLNPPLDIGGVGYSLAVRFRDHFANRTRGSSSIVSGTIYSVTALAGNRWRVTCARAGRNYSYTKVTAPGDSIEVEYQCTMGGNIASTPEPLRAYSWNESTANRGSDGRTRALPADVLEIDGKRFFITEANPYAVAPASVAWQSGDAVPTISRLENTCNTATNGGAVGNNQLRLDYEPENGGSLVVDASGILAAPEVHIISSDPVPVELLLDRKIFNNGTGTPVAEYYPDDASFLDTGHQYWLSPIDGRLILSSYIYDHGSTIRARYWAKGNDYYATTGERICTIPDGACSYGATDTVLSHAQMIRGDFDESFIVYDGSGFIEWRRSFGKNPDGTYNDANKSICVSLGWTVSGSTATISVSGGGRRATYGSAFSTVSTVTGSYTLPFYVRLVKAGADFTFYHSADGVSWTTAFTVNIAAVTSYSDGWLGLIALGTGGTIAGGFPTAQNYKLEIGQTGTIGVRREVTWTGVSFYVSATLPVTTAITAVLDVTTGETMTKRVNPGDQITRALYDRIGDIIYFWGEGAGDRYKITQAADPLSPPSAPGLAPNISGIVNFADGGSTVADNHAHYYDELIIYDGDSEFTGGAGDSFDVYRDAFCDPRDPPAIAYDIRGLAGTDWATVDAANYLARWVDGLVLFKTTWVDSLGETSRLCLRLLGSLMRHSCGITQRVENDHITLLENADLFWFRAGVIGGTTNTFCGLASMSVNALAKDGVGVVTAYGFSTLNSTIITQCEFWNTRGGQFPGWETDGTFLIYSQWNQGTWMLTGGGDPTIGTADECLAGVVLSNWFPPLTTPYFGSACMYSHGGSPQNFGTWTSSFRITGYIVDITGLKWLAGFTGASIIGVKATMKFSGAESKTWVMDYTGAKNPADAVWSYTVNGNLVESESVYNPANNVFAPGGTISMELVGKRLDTQQVYLYPPSTDYPMDQENSSYESFGSFPATAFADELTHTVDMTGFGPALLAAARSQCTTFFLWPSTSPAASSHATGVLSYLRGLFPTYSCTFHGDGGDTWYDYNVAGEYVQFTSFEITDIYVKVRLSSGEISSCYLPIARQKFIT